MQLARVITLALVCIILNLISFCLSRTYGEYNLQIFLMAQGLIVLSIFLALIVFKGDKTRVESEVLDELLEGRLMSGQSIINANEMETKLLGYQSSIRKFIADVYGVVRIADSTGIYLRKDLNNITQAADNIASSVNYMASGNSDIANSVVKASQNMIRELPIY